MSLEPTITGKTKRRTQPFLKWAGGKRWLVQAGLPSPASFDRLVEPFLGSAAVFFSVQPPKALLTDVNEELINLYRSIQSNADKVRLILEWHHTKHSPEHYYQIRAREYKDDAWRAARMLYLNRTCWNGLYRVNKKGQFNVPIGTKSAVLMDTDNFSDYSLALKSAELICQDFEVTVDACGKGDFLFVDPPYTVKHNLNGFLKYNENIFSWDDQMRLVEALRRASDRGASIVVTNADHHSVRDLYSDDFTYRQISRHSVLAGTATHRGVTTEAIFTLNLDQCNVMDEQVCNAAIPPGN